MSAATMVEPCREPERWSDDEYSADPRIELVAIAIAEKGVGQDWSDFAETDAFEMDRDDIRAYAKAAINALAACEMHGALAGVICKGCGSSWTDERLTEERAKNPAIRSCCPERNPQPVYYAAPLTESN